jgi:hypothetical protein
LGEKSYVPDDKKWPVEIRLLLLILLNAIIFIFGKIIMKKTGASVFGMMKAQNPTINNPAKQTKRKMKGPNIDISTIPDIENIQPNDANGSKYVPNSDT